MYYDVDRDRYWTEEELRADYEELKRNGDLEDYYDTFEYYLEACMFRNNGSLKEVPEGMDKVEEVIKDLFQENEWNVMSPHGEYDKGYYEGYHDALVALMDTLGIRHNEEIINQ